MQQRALAADDYDRFAPLPVAHLRERMPDEFAVKRGQFVHGDF
jgi:hypothetical protein